MKGMRIGILARDTHKEAWNDARNRFPETRAGQLAHQLAEKTSDSEWHKKLSGQNGNGEAEEPVYWLGPFHHYHTFCPYLVGDYDEVANLLSTYLEAGCTTCILDIPVAEQELQDTMNVFKQASKKVLQT
jgi:alkanesulfonate monooxygenase